MEKDNIWLGKFSQILEGWKNYYFPNEAIEEIAKDRASICASCEHNIKNTCNICKCPLSKKVRSLKTNCPKMKW